jgi:hypothetical protein
MDVQLDMRLANQKESHSEKYWGHEMVKHLVPQKDFLKGRHLVNQKDWNWELRSLLEHQMV